MWQPLEKYLATGLKSVKGWLGFPDAQIILSILKFQSETLALKGACAEIGVHHGKLFIALCLGLRPDEKAYCIDIFSDQEHNLDRSGHGDLDILKRNLSRNGVAPSSYVIRQSSSFDVTADEVIQAVGPVRFFSVDGGHWLEIVENDLRIAELALCEGGVIAMDDFHRAEWPDVSAGYFSWYSKKTKDIVPFMIGFNKLYLCHRDYCKIYQAYLANDENLKIFRVRDSVFQGQPLPVYSEFIYAEFEKLKLSNLFVRTFWPRLYIRLNPLVSFARSKLKG